MFNILSTDSQGISNNAHKSRFLIAAGTQAHFAFKSVKGLNAISETHAIKLSPSPGPHNPAAMSAAKSNSLAEEFANHIGVGTQFVL